MFDRLRNTPIMMTSLKPSLILCLTFKFYNDLDYYLLLIDLFFPRPPAINNLINLLPMHFFSTP